MCVCGSALLKRLIRSLVKPAAMPDHSVSFCGSVAATPDEQAAAHSETSTAATVFERRRKRDDVVVTQPLPANGAGSREARLYGQLLRFGHPPAADDN